MSGPRCLVLGDLHLTRQTPASVAADAAGVVRAHPGARIIIAGDLLDLSVDAPKASREQAIKETFDALPDVRAALGQHVESGADLWLVGGNHDADIARIERHRTVCDALRLSAEARKKLRTTPWFFREGALHVEHGHYYDPDNAPAHPLGVGRRSLGVRFAEDFIAPTGAHRYLNANDKTPWKLLTSSFEWYGVRATHIIYRYFRTAFTALAYSGPFYDASAELRDGSERERAFAREVGVSEDVIDALRKLGATPRMESLPDTFHRLYLDRVAGFVALIAGLTRTVTGAPRGGMAAAALGALSLAASWQRGYDRYGGSVGERLSWSAAQVAEATGAGLVVFGHTHLEDQAHRYANTGSFAFPGRAPGRPFLEIEGGLTPRAVRRHFSSPS